MSQIQTYEQIMGELLLVIKKSSPRDDIPVSAAVVNSQNKIVAIEINKNIELSDPSAHAELLAIKSASKKLNTSRLDDFILISTLEPCLMCTGVIIQSRINKVIFGAFEPKTGFIVSLFPTIKEFKPDIEVISGVLESECSKILTEWFSKKR
jgi:tRNA(adenine34) deaminase